jgi:hypothetical protein
MGPRCCLPPAKARRRSRARNYTRSESSSHSRSVFPPSTAMRSSRSCRRWRSTCRLPRPAQCCREACAARSPRARDSLDSTLAVVERADLVLDEIDHVTYARLLERRYCGFWSGLRWGRRIQTWWSGCATWCGLSRWRANAPWLWTRPELARRWWTCCSGHSWDAGSRR